MSLYTYKFSVVGGAEKSGKITAKTEQAARDRLAKEHSIVTWHNFAEAKVITSKPVAAAKNVTPKPTPLTVKPVTPKTSSKLEKLLYLQSNKCFFCGRELTKAEASVEHLLPKSKGGSNDDGNVVVCCVTLNRTFGSMDLKEKVRIILEKAGNFTCPKA